MTEKTGWFSRAFGRAKATENLNKKQAQISLSQGFVALHNGLDAGWTSASYGALAREGFMRNPIVHRCVRMICESASSLPWLVYDGVEEQADHPALALIKNPNMFQSQSAFLETVLGHLLLSGNAYLEYTPYGDNIDSGNIYALRPDRVSVDADTHGWPSAYIYQVDNHKRRIELQDDGRIARIAQLKLFNPLDDVNGFPPLQAALMALDTHNAASTWNKALLDNSARPSGALVYAPSDGSNLSPEQFEQLKGELENGYSGASNVGRPLLLEGGLDWKSMGLSPKEMDFIEAKNSASRDIALAFGVPPMLLGIPGDNTYSNYQEANRAFFRLTILPMLRRLTEAMADWLRPEYGQNIRFEIDVDQIESLSAEREALWTRLENSTFLNDDEKRQAVGYSPLGGQAE